MINEEELYKSRMKLIEVLREVSERASVEVDNDIEIKNKRNIDGATIGGVLSNVNVNNSFVETSDINDINYISEGFMSRYLFNLKAKSTGFFNKLIKAIGVVVVLAAAVVATVFTCGVGGIFVGAAVTAAGSVAASLGTIGLISGIALGVSATAISAQTIALKAR